jgi:hypothetical protein
MRPTAAGASRPRLRSCEETHQYLGIADAAYQNIDIIESYGARSVCSPVIRV